MEKIQALYEHEQDLNNLNICDMTNTNTTRFTWWCLAPEGPASLGECAFSFLVFMHWRWLYWTSISKKERKSTSKFIHACDLRNPKVASILMSIFENTQNNVIFPFPIQIGF